MTAFWRPLLHWYKQSGRILPWRATQDPYAIWVSEIMLQQTQVATVLPYYHRFLAAFPTVRALAAAPLDAVLKLWQGMGYYARARSLYHAACIIVEQFQGVLPSSYEALCSLPGIGRSTCGAILNIAFLQRHPICDGNVKRILIRYFGIRENLQNHAMEKQLWHWAEQILPPSQVNHFTQAIMDLGATICLPKSPQCAVCPVQKGCKTYRTGINRTAVRKASQIPHYDYVAAIIQKGTSVLIKKRPQKGLLGGLWEFPGGRMEPGDDIQEKIAREVGHPLHVTSTDMAFKQTFSHFKMTLQLVRGTTKGFSVALPLKWVSISRLGEYPFSSTHQKIAAWLAPQRATAPV